MTCEPQNRIFITSKCRIELLDNEICFFQYKKGEHIELEDYLEAHIVLLEISEEKIWKILVEFPKNTSISQEARKYAEQTNLDVTAQAIIISTLAQRILVRFYYLVRRSQFPIKIFEIKNDAIKWLKSLD